MKIEKWAVKFKYSKHEYEPIHVNSPRSLNQPFQIIFILSYGYRSDKIRASFVKPFPSYTTLKTILGQSLVNIYPLRKNALIRRLPCLEDVLNTLWNEKKNQKFCIVKSHFLSFTSTNPKNKFENVLFFRYLYGCYIWKSNACAEYLIRIYKNS